jgi:putative nucleotidyltransferase with HDIG domain
MADVAAPQQQLPQPVLESLSNHLRHGTLELPVLSEVARQVVSVTNDENADARKLADLINRDQAIAGNLMRIVNSATYSTSDPIVSLQQAVSRLGMKKIREIALIISCQSKVFMVAGHEEEVRAQFRHSLAAAAIAQEVARSRRWNVEEAFLCGLLHDVGRPVLLQTLVDLHRDFDCCLVPAALEFAITKLHCHVGSEMVKTWKLPARLSEAILRHHEPLKSTTASQVACMTNLSDDLAHFMFDAKPKPEEELREHPMLAPLNLYPEEMDALLAKRPMIEQMIRSIS